MLTSSIQKYFLNLSLFHYSEFDLWEGSGRKNFKIETQCKSFTISFMKTVTLLKMVPLRSNVEYAYFTVAFITRYIAYHLHY